MQIPSLVALTTCFPRRLQEHTIAAWTLPQAPKGREQLVRLWSTNQLKHYCPLILDFAHSISISTSFFNPLVETPCIWIENICKGWIYWMCQPLSFSATERVHRISDFTPRTWLVCVCVRVSGHVIRLRECIQLILSSYHQQSFPTIRWNTTLPMLRACSTIDCIFP